MRKEAEDKSSRLPAVGEGKRDRVITDRDKSITFRHIPSDPSVACPRAKDARLRDCQIEKED